MKIWFYIGVGCVVVGLYSVITACSFLPNEADAQKGHPNLKVATLFKVIGGIPDTETPPRKIRLEFAIAPMMDNHPLLDEARIVSSDENGEFEINLPPGRYWIGPKGRAVDRDRYDPGGSEVQQMIVEVEADGMTRVDLFRMDYAP